MGQDHFFQLLTHLKVYLPPDEVEQKRKRGKTPNGPITHALRLSMALRYFAGGDPLDICERHLVGEGEVLRSVWLIVDALHKVDAFKIVFPTSHSDQLVIADGFKAKLSIGIDNCVGAIDGILIWTHKPSNAFLEEFGVGPAKFFCGRKGKFGLNMQAVCDANGRFLDVYIGCPGAASDYYSFSDSPLKKKLENEGFLYPGLCLFGDNAYLNTPYMLTGFRNVSKQSDIFKDAFNFYQSQVRINIECAFGQLVHRWGMLRKPIAVNIGVCETMLLLTALCKLHNYCLDEKELASTAAEDVRHVFKVGGLLLPRLDEETDESYWSYDPEQDRVNELLDGGDHSNDYERKCHWQRFSRVEHLPFKLLLTNIIENRYTRP